MPLREQRQMIAAVAHNLIRYRKARRLSLDGLRTLSGVSKRTIIEIEQERGNPSIATLCRLANAMGVGVTELIALVNEPKRLQLHSIKEGRILWKTPSGSLARLIAGTSVLGVWAEFWYWKLSPGERFRGAAHPPGTRELLYVLGGKLCVETRGESLCAAPSQLITLTAEEAHSYRNESEKGTEFLMIVLEFSGSPKDQSILSLRGKTR
jgi:transcriptional regulator with XRE-family HTH domain